jgi:hypothetical protein
MGAHHQSALQAMNLQEQIEMFERLVAKYEQDWQRLFGYRATSPTAQVAYLNDVVPYKNIVKMLYIKDDRPVCWGAADCLTKPTTRCAGDHETCQTHASDCFQCRIDEEKVERAGK